MSINNRELSTAKCPGKTADMTSPQLNTPVEMRSCTDSDEIVRVSGDTTPVIITTEMFAGNHVLLLEGEDGTAFANLPIEAGTADLNNFNIILDADVKQVLLSNGPEQGQPTFQEVQIVHSNDIDTTQSEKVQITEDSKTGSHSAESSKDSPPTSILFRVCTEDGSYHKVPTDIEHKLIGNTDNEVEMPKGKGNSTGVSGTTDQEERPFQCDLCSATFTRLGNYTRHKMIHTIHIKEDYRYKCDVCGRMFLQRCDLKRHLLVHEGNLPHVCDECGKGYIRKSDLLVHIRFHNGERSFPCTECSKAFFQSGDLQRHIRQVHQRTKPLTCGHCQRKYTKEATLIRHMQTVHRDIILSSLSGKVVHTLEEQSSESRQPQTTNSPTVNVNTS